MSMRSKIDWIKFFQLYKNQKKKTLKSSRSTKIHRVYDVTECLVISKKKNNSEDWQNINWPSNNTYLQPALG